MLLSGGRLRLSLLSLLPNRSRISSRGLVSHQFAPPSSSGSAWNGRTCPNPVVRVDLAAGRYRHYSSPVPVPGYTVDTMADESIGNFDLIKRVKLDFADVVVSKWRSRVSGLSMVHLDYEAPIVKGYFVVPTEIFNDSGVPHTLEHLVFMGSEKYPYKGILDNLANRAYSAGTNAWTDTDHTAYTIATAGEEGFLRFLPIYVDHILYPTMTDAAFTTEVHHVDGKGQNSGVVYSEMQGRENTSGDLMALRMQRLFYQKTSAYRSETGGLQEALRVLTAQEIRDYHGKYYVPHNLCLIVAGKLSTPHLLEILQTKVENRIAEHHQTQGPRPPGWKRPFVETPSADVVKIAETVKEVVEFPEPDESMGEVTIAFVGPPPNEFLAHKALDIIGRYLTDSAVAPLTKEYVEIASPLCSYIYFSENTRTSFTDMEIYLGSVPTEHLDTLDIKIRSSLEKIVADGLDMERMAVVLKRDRLKFANELEASRGDAFSGHIIQDLLYGQEDGGHLGPSMDQMSWYPILSNWTTKQWTDLIHKYFIAPSCIVIKGKPSAALAEKIEKDEKARIEAQIKKLGPDGLAKLEEKLQQSRNENEKPIPSEILTSFPIPDVASISWINVQSARNDPAAPQLPDSELGRHLQADPVQLPYFVQFDHVKSEFVTINAILSLDNIPDRLRPYINLYQTSFFALPIVTADGKELSHEEVVKLLDRDTVSYEANLGYGSIFQELFRAGVKVEKENYALGLALLRDSIFASKFTKDRIEVAIAKIQQMLPEFKRDGNNVVSSVSTNLLYGPSSSNRAGTVTTLMEWIPKVAQELQETPEKVLSDLEELRKLIIDPSGLRFSVTGNILALPSPRKAWKDTFASPNQTQLKPIRLGRETLSELGKNPVGKSVVVTLPTIESSFAIHSTKTLHGFDHPDLPALRVACETLDGTESYLWQSIRGSGLAYGANLVVDPESSLLSFSLYRSPNSFLAFQRAAEIVGQLADGTLELDITKLEAAKSSLVYAQTRSVGSPGSAAATSFINQALKGVPQDFGRQQLEKYNAITPQQVIETIRKYILPLFDAKSSIGVVVSSPAKAEEIASGLSGLGFEVEKRTLDIGADEDGEGSDSGSDSSDR